MTTQATVKNIQSYKTSLNDVFRAVIEIEESAQPLLVIGTDAAALSACIAGTILEIVTTASVQMIDNRYAFLIDHAHAV